MKTIKVVHVPVGEDSRVIEIENTLDAMHKLVGGFLEFVHMGDGVTLVCNEDGIGLDLPQNGCGMLGPYFFMKVDDENEENIDLTEGECNALRAHVAMYRLIKHPGTSNPQVISFNSLEEMEVYLNNWRRNRKDGLN